MPPSATIKTAPAKKPADTYFKYDKASIENTQKYIYHSHQGAIYISLSKCGLNWIGSKHMEAFIQKHLDEIKEAALLDTVGLSDPRLEVFEDHCPSKQSGESTMSKHYSRNDTPLLPWPVEIMNTQEVITWSLPELRKDICEVSGEPLTKISWGSAKHKPKEWPFEWSLMTNPTHAQLYQEEIEKQTGRPWTNTTILQEYIRIRLLAKGLNPSEHIGKYILMIYYYCQARAQLQLNLKSQEWVNNVKKDFFIISPYCEDNQ